MEEAVAPKRSGLGYGGVKIIREMYRKIKSVLISYPTGRQEDKRNLPLVLYCANAIIFYLITEEYRINTQ